MGIRKMFAMEHDKFEHEIAVEDGNDCSSNNGKCYN